MVPLSLLRVPAGQAYGPATQAELEVEPAGATVEPGQGVQVVAPAAPE